MKDLKNHAFVFFGSPGCGKNENSHIVTAMGYHHIEMGALLKANASPEKLASINRGELANDDWVHDLVVANTPDPTADLKLLYNGVPRSIEQSRRLIQMLTRLYQMPITTVFFTVDKEVALHRLLKRGRSDDERKAALDRLQKYEAYAPGVICHLRRNSGGPMIEINANKPLDEVRGEVLKIVHSEQLRLKITDPEETRQVAGEVSDAAVMA